jgi:suppressor of ftsI
MMVAVTILFVGCAMRSEQTALRITSAVPFSQAPVLQSKSSQLQFALGTATEFPEGVPAFSFRGKVGVAPTLRVKAGDTLSVDLKNGLPLTNYTADNLNLHFHGLDVSPAVSEDNITTMLAAPSHTLHYKLHIPLTQQPGLYWYHPHSHGEAYWQITSGMSGAIIIEGLNNDIPALRGLKERLLILRDLQQQPNIITIPWYARLGTIGAQRAFAKTAGDPHYAPTDPNDVLPRKRCGPEAGMMTAIEGADDGTIRIASGERQFFRVLNASAARVYDLEIPGERLGLAAIDGYALSTYPGNPSIAWVDHIVVPPGGRAEFIATGQNTEALLRSQCYDSGAVGDRDPEINLARLQPPVSEASDADRSVTTGTARKVSVVPVGAPSVRRTVTFTEDGDGYYINGKRFDMKSMEPMFTVQSGTLEEWTVNNDTDEIHALHIHQVHFTVTKINGKPIGLHYWCDTAIVPPMQHIGKQSRPGSITILVDFRNPVIKGLFPFHCHMLDHEDGGMMALIRVI